MFLGITMSMLGHGHSKGPDKATMISTKGFGHRQSGNPIHSPYVFASADLTRGTWNPMCLAWFGVPKTRHCVAEVCSAYCDVTIKLSSAGLSLPNEDGRWFIVVATQGDKMR